MSSPVDSSSSSPAITLPSTSVLAYIHKLSGQSRKSTIIENEHSYSKCWNRHPDPSIKSRPARFLFMGSFVRQLASEKDHDDELIDIESVDDASSLFSSLAVNPLVAEVSALTKGQSTVQDDLSVTDSAPNKSTWSPLAQRIWAKALNILYSDRLIRLTIDGSPNEVIIKKMLANRCANKFRHLFSSMAHWDASILSWLHGTLLEHVSGHYLTAYYEAMQILRQKVPGLIDRFYTASTNDPSRGRNKGLTPDPIQNVLNNHKPKRIKNCPLFILVPNGPQVANSIIPQRLKHWQILFASLGKIITLSISYRPTLRVKDCLNEIISGVRDKINECRGTFTEGRPIVLVGFGHSSLIAAHAALDSASRITATVCLGFPLTGVNGFRGDLDDPLLETTVPTLFIIGQNSTMSSIDDMEDFRERITKAETGLVVVGGANDNLIVSQTKQRFAGITQAIVDRCIADEIYDFINYVLNPHYVPSDNNHVAAPLRQSTLFRSFSPSSASSTPTLSNSFSTPNDATSNNTNINNKASGAKNGAMTKPKPRRRRKATESQKSEESKTKDIKAEPATTSLAITDSSSTAMESDRPAPLPLPAPISTPKRKRNSGNAESATNLAGNSEDVAIVPPTPPPTKKRREEEPLSISSIEKIEQTLDEVINGIGLDLESSPSPPPEPNVTSKPTETKANSQQQSSATTTTTTTTTPTTNYFGRHYDFSYGVSEVATLPSASNTRTRQIRAPKQLDI